MTERTDIDLEFNHHGQLCNPQLHDGLVIGVSLRSEDSCEIEVRTVSGIVYTLMIDGIERLLVDGFGLGNVILDVVVQPLSDVPPVDLIELYGVHSASDGEATLRKALSRLDAETLRVIEINPSVGCQVTAVCKTLRVRTLAG